MKKINKLLSLKVTITFAILFSGYFLSAQHTHRFTEGLYMRIPSNYGREAVYSDEFLWNYYLGKLVIPRTGQQATSQGASEEFLWTPVVVDTSGFFRPTPGGSGNLRNPNNPAGPGRIETVSRTTTISPSSQRRGVPSGYLYVTYQSSKAQDAVLNVKGNSAALVNGELHAGDPYRMGWLDIPVKLKKGLNEFYFRGTFISAELKFPDKPVYLSSEDLTLPDIVQGKDNTNLLVGMVVVNNSAGILQDLEVRSSISNKSNVTKLPTIPAYSTRKIAVRINGSDTKSIGEAKVHLSLIEKGKLIDEQQLNLRSVSATTTYRNTFVSEIDGSVQYYAVNPATAGEKSGDALFFSVHGAGVEALGQAQAYGSKDWGTLVAPTNRRPRGFNWEDWGRLDALEVLALAKASLQPDSQRIYLTGHSMGGHGTWFLGATYPDKWAAIAPCAGYPTLKGYGSADGIIPEKGQNALENILLRASNQSDVTAYASNYKPLGIYILHGDADRTVSVEYAREMRRVLSGFHPDFSYYEYPGGSHWYSNESVDWKPLFDYFQWHKRKISSEVNEIDFITANPGISTSYHWAGIYQQDQPLVYSQIILSRDIKNGRIEGTTKNIRTLSLNLNDFPIGMTVSIMLDSLNTIDYRRLQEQPTIIYLQKTEQKWSSVQKPSPIEKGPQRNGNFKEAFNHRMVYVYGTRGSDEENKWALEKTRYDAESWYYRGNGAFDIIADNEFDPEAYADRNIILIGNRKTNSAWDSLLADCPITVESTHVKVGNTDYKGADIGGYFIWKKHDNDINSIGVITGTGIKGMKTATANQYFAGASGFPDYMFYTLDMLKNGSENVISAGFYDNQWQIGN